jgi:hypothetical protein
MFRIFLTAICLALFPLGLAAKTTQTLSEINADLKAKKAELEPFNEKDVKVDVESLGLDDLDKKEKKPEEKPKENPIVPNAEPEKKPEGESLQADPEKKESTSILDKIKNFLNKKDADKAEEAQPTEEELKKKAETEKYINSQKKKQLKKRLEEEKRRKENEELQQKKLKKLNELREQYLIKIDADSGQESDEDFDENEEKIVPHKKEINRFITEELPAPPILNRFRTAENMHIPTVLTPKEKIDTLFEAIASGNIGFFNSAYKNVDNSNAKNQFGDTILTYATLTKKYSVIASVLSKGADPNKTNNLGYTPLDIAIEMLDSKALELLIENKADINYLDNFGRTYLMHAARVGFLPAVESLVSRGADVNAMDNDGFTALSIAYRHKKEIIVKYLLKNGAKTWIEKPYDPQNQSLIKELENRWK